MVNPDAFFYDPQPDQFVAVGYGEHNATAVWALAADGSFPGGRSHRRRRATPA